MAATNSQMIELGTNIPQFELFDTVSNKILNSNDLLSELATVVLFICNHCPFVKHINSGITDLSNDYLGKGVSIIAISSNDVENYPDDSPEKMTQNAKDNNWNFPYLFDEKQQVAKDFGAVCTPDIFLYDGNGKLVYRGQFDSSRPNNLEPVTGADLRSAIEKTLSGDGLVENQTPSIGCNIKWKK